MLEHLNDVPWSELKSFYGKATAVPDLLRRLVGRDRQQHRKDLAELCNLVCHQADHSQASAPCVPFVMELVKRQSTLHRDLLLGFLQTIAIGCDFDMLAMKANVSQHMEERAQAAAKLSEKKKRELNHGPAISVACYNAVRACVPDFIPLLQDRQAKVRIQAAYNLAWFPMDSRKSLAVLRRYMRSVRTTEELAMAILSVGLLEQQAAVARPSVAFVRPLLHERREVLHYTAAIYLFWHKPSDEVQQALEELSQNDDYDYGRDSKALLFAGGSWNQYASFLLESD